MQLALRPRPRSAAASQGEQQAAAAAAAAAALRARGAWWAAEAAAGWQHTVQREVILKWPPMTSQAALGKGVAPEEAGWMLDQSCRGRVAHLVPPWRHREGRSRGVYLASHRRLYGPGRRGNALVMAPRLHCRGLRPCRRGGAGSSPAASSLPWPHRRESGASHCPPSSGPIWQRGARSCAVQSKQRLHVVGWDCPGHVCVWAQIARAWMRQFSR